MQTIHLPAAALGLAALAAPASAQGPVPAAILDHTLDCYVTDAGNDTVWRLSDLNLDGDYDDAGEVVAFYDELVGTIALGNNNSIAVAPNGLVFVSDTSSDQVVALVDRDGDGTAHGANEHWVFFDGDPAVNLSGIAVESPNAIALDTRGRVYVADADNSAGQDAIIVLEDLDGDGTANGVGEARFYYLPIGFGSIGDVIPNSVDFLPDGTMLYLEGGSTGQVVKGLYRLEDLDRDGVIDPFSEVGVYFLPPTLGSDPFMWDFGVEADGTVYVADTGNDVIWRMRDANGDGGIDNTSELDLFWTAPAASIVWTVQPNERGQLLLAETQSPDRLVLLEDLDGSGAIDAMGEERVVYSDVTSAVDISNPRGLCWRRAPRLEARATAAVGGDVPYALRGTLDEEAILLGSLGTAATRFAGYGILELDLQNGFFRADSLVIGPGGAKGGTLRLPNDPSLSGQTLHLQGLVGTAARRAFTNRVDVLVQ